MAAVELAIILPFLGMLLIGTLELGLLARDHQAIQNAAREAARFSAMPENKIQSAVSPAATRANIESIAIAYLANDGITLSSSEITINQGMPMTIDGLAVFGSQIEIRYGRPLLFGFLDSIGFSDFALYGQALFRNFYGGPPPGLGGPPTPVPVDPPPGGGGGRARGRGRG